MPKAAANAIQPTLAAPNPTANPRMRGLRLSTPAMPAGIIHGRIGTARRPG